MNNALEIKVREFVIDFNKMEIDILKQKQKEEEEKSSLIKVNDVIVYHSKTELQLRSVYHKKGKTLILINLDTGTIYRQKFNHDFPSPSNSANDFIVTSNELVWPLQVILNAFGINRNKISHISKDK